MQKTCVFSPRPSLGWLWLALIGAFVFGVTTLPLLAVGLPDEPLGLAIMAVGVIIGVGFLLLAGLFPSMRYTLGADELALSYGPFTLYRIPYKSIHKISWQDLTISLLSSFRLPGFALFSVMYADIGTVKMCSSSMAKHILIIQAGKSLYGITPADEKQFVAALMERVKG